MVNPAALDARQGDPMTGFTKKLARTTAVAIILVLSTGLSALSAPSDNGASHRSSEANGNSNQNANSHSQAASESASASLSTSTQSTTTTCDGDPSGKSGSGSGANSNPAGTFTNSCDWGSSGNGNGGGLSVGKPCAGCVGQADDKNPPGHKNDPSGSNRGYECSTNHGIARTNPAHTGCRNNPPNNPKFGSSISIASVSCTNRNAAVTLSNTNSAAARSFSVSLDGANQNITVPAGGSATTTLTVPNDGNHSISATSSNPGGSSASQAFARLTNCTEVLGEKITKGSLVLAAKGQTLPFTGMNSMVPMELALSLLVVGFMMEARSRRTKVAFASATPVTFGAVEAWQAPSGQDTVSFFSAGWDEDLFE